MQIVFVRSIVSGLTRSGIKWLAGISLLMASSAWSQTCAVLDTDLQGSYKGDCVNGLADGMGVAKGRDTYEGAFSAGNPNGVGVYTWGQGTAWAGDRFEGTFKAGDRVSGVYRYQWGLTQEGTFRNNRLHGSGIVRVPADSPIGQSLAAHGQLEGGRRVVKGVWDEDQLFAECSDDPVCDQKASQLATNEVLACMSARNAYQTYQTQAEGVSLMSAGQLYRLAAPSPDVSFSAFETIPRRKQEEIALSTAALSAVRNMTKNLKLPTSFERSLLSVTSDGDMDLSTAKRIMEGWVASCRAIAPAR